MANRYRKTQGHLYEEFQERLVDPILIAIIRHHGETAQEQKDIVRFCSSPFDTEQLCILLPLLGSRRKMLDVDVTQVASSQGISVKVDFGGMWWHPRGEIVIAGRPPELILSALPGRSVRDVVEHPYVPQDMVINDVSEGGGVWRLHVRAHEQSHGKTMD